MPWPTDPVELDAEQRRLAALTPPPWTPLDEARPLSGHTVAGCFLAFARGEQGPGHAGDRGWSAAALVAGGSGGTVGSSCVRCQAGASYEPGLLALREGACLAAAIAALPRQPTLLLVDATGRDHPRRAGLALHLGAVLDLPSIGVTHRPLLATGPEPGPAIGSSTPLALDGEAVGAWVRTKPGVRPVAVHAGWRIDVALAVAIVLQCGAGARTPEPLRRARVLARTTRAHSEGRTSQPWRDPLR